MRDSVRHFVAEFVGTFALVFVGGASIAAGGGLVGVALAHGIILAVMVSATMRISGHFNPAVTVGFLAARRIEPMMAGVYVAAQIIAAILAAYALKGLLPAQLATATRLGGQSISLDVTLGLAIGLTIAADILAIGPFTGGSMNPARSFGPAVASGIFEGQAVYWIGPLVGAVAASLLYDTLFIRREREPVDHGAVRP